ncbi:MAG: replicative DNA helicase [Alphaproteobacteria bacterium]|nr:MAG: replicative DNA helicase [Alphaproteobacteria bacterium]
MSDITNIPHNLEAEQALLGAILAQNEAYWQVAEFLRPEDFINPFHGTVYECFGDIEKCQTINPVTLTPRLKNHATAPEGLTVAVYLSRLAAAAVSIIHTGEYGKIVHDLSLKRQLMTVTRAGLIAAGDMTDNIPAKEVRENIEQELHALDRHDVAGTGLEDMSVAVGLAMEQVDLAMKHGGDVIGVNTGLYKLNQATGGWREGSLIVVAGRPSMGKTALALNLARAAAQNGFCTAFFSLEMQSYQLGQRLISDMTWTPQQSVSYFHAGKGGLSMDEYNIFARAGQQAAKLPLYITDKGGVTPSTIRIECMRLKRRLEREDKKLSMVVIDYLQLMTAGERYRGNKVQEVSEITAAMKVLAKELSVPIILLSQLSRAVESRENKRPILSDLRDSGSIEQDADDVIFVYREEYYLALAEPKQADKLEEWMARCARVENQLDIIIAKQRNGPLATVGVDFFKESSAMRDRAYE